MSRSAGISVSVVLYKTDPAIFHGLHGLIRKSPSVGDIYIIDNSPSPCIDASRYPDIEFIHQPGNPGYGTGHNRGLRKALEKSAYHIVMNPDIRFDPAIIETLKARMEKSADVGLIMPMIRYPDGRLQYVCRLLPTPLELLVRRFVPAWMSPLFHEYLERRELRFTGYNHEMDVPFLSGCFMFLRTAALADVGLFDERYFMYAEDLDLSRRIHARFRTLFYPGAEVIHDHNRTSYKNFRMMTEHALSIIRYFNKWGWFRDKERGRVNGEALQKTTDSGLVKENT